MEGPRGIIYDGVGGAKAAPRPSLLDFSRGKGVTSGFFKNEPGKLLDLREGGALNEEDEEVGEGDVDIDVSVGGEGHRSGEELWKIAEKKTKWALGFSEQYKTKFYINSDTGDAVWERPKDFDGEESKVFGRYKDKI